MHNLKLVKWFLALGFLAFAAMLLYLGFRKPVPITVTLVNNSSCVFVVKVNHVPSHVLGVTSEGPLLALQPDTMVLLKVPSQKEGIPYHVPAFGINREQGAERPIVVGDQSTPLGTSRCNYFSCTPCVKYQGSPRSPMLVIE